VPGLGICAAVWRREFADARCGARLQPLLLRGLDAIRPDSPEGFFALAALATLVAVSLTLPLCVLWFRFSIGRRA
jgi:hypothetical protein